MGAFTAVGEADTQTETQETLRPVGEEGARPPGAEAATQQQAADSEGVDAGEPNWIEIRDGLLDHEAIKPQIEQRVEAARSEATEQGRRAAQSQLQPHLERQAKSYERISDMAESFVSDWNEAWADFKENPGDRDTQRALRKVVDDPKVQQALGAISGAHYGQGAVWGGSAFINAIGQQTGMDKETMSAFASDMKLAYEQQLQGETPNLQFVERFVSQVTKSAADKAAQDARERALKEGREIGQAQARGQERQGTKPPVNTSGRGSGGRGPNPDDVLRDPKATATQKEEAFNRKHGIDINEAARR